jgi:hypothetical protein
MVDEEARLKVLEKIRTFGLKLPADWKFDRDEANSRGTDDDVKDASEPQTSNPTRRS